MARPSRLSSPSRQMVLDALRSSSAPMTAYELLHMLKKNGIKSPPIIYRALESLENAGKVHKIKELAAYVACNCEVETAHRHHGISVLTVCVNCQKVVELHDHAVIDYLVGLARLGIKLSDNAVIELPIVCECHNL